MMLCAHCSTNTPDHIRYCKNCGADVGCPNVRICQSELKELEERYQNAHLSIKARNIEAESGIFESLVSIESFASINKQIDSLISWLSEENKPLKSYYKQVASGDRSPEDNYYDEVREKVDSALFPYFKEEICFAMLSFNNQAEEKYGPCAAELKENLISSRASVFEENSINFMKKHNISITADSTPIKSYRADWKQRGKLALSKLHSKIQQGMGENDLKNLLYTPTTNQDGDFIEVHIFGDISKETVKRITIRKNKTPKIPTLRLKMLNMKAKALGIAVEEI